LLPKYKLMLEYPKVLFKTNDQFVTLQLENKGGLLHYDVVMLVLNDVAHDGRVLREASALAGDGWRVLVVGTQRANGSLPDREQRDGFDLWRVRYGGYGASLRRPWRWMRHGLQAVQIWRTLRPVQSPVYHAHDLPALLLLGLVRRRLVYDAHDLFLFLPPYPSKWMNRWQSVQRPWLMLIERRLAHRADAVLGLCEARTRAMARWYHIPRPTVIHNIVDPVDDCVPAPVDLRTVVGPDRFIVVHTGHISDRGRCLTELVQAMAYVPEQVALVFVGSSGEWDHLHELAVRLGVEARVSRMLPVAPDQVAATIRQADVAACVLRPHAYNTRASIPNKLWEAVAAGVPLVAGDTFGVRRLVKRYELGVLCDPTDPRAIAAAIERMMDPAVRNYYREKVGAAQNVLRWDNEAEKLRIIYRRLLDGTDRCAK